MRCYTISYAAGYICLSAYLSDEIMNLKDFPVTATIPVQWGEMDAAQHVNNVIYLRWSETGRIAYFKRLGYDVSPGGNEAGFILGWQDCKYIFPVTYPDTIHLGVQVTKIEKDKFLMECHMFSEKHNRIVAISQHRIVTYNYTTFQKVDIPDGLRNKIEKLEGKIEEDDIIA